MLRGLLGRKVFGGVTQYIPMKVNQAGVMPIIFAQSIMFIPNTFLSFFPNSDFMQGWLSISIIRVYFTQLFML